MERNDDILTNTIIAESYCLKCRKWTYEIVEHKCSKKYCIIIDGVMVGIVDRIYELGIIPNEAGFLLNCVDNKSKIYNVRLYIYLSKGLNCEVLGKLPEGWQYYREPEGKIYMLGFSDHKHYKGVFAAKERVKEIAKKFEVFLDTIDKNLVNALLLLSDG